MIRMTVQKLSLRRDEIRLLDEIDLEARPGSCHVILGPPGSGKTVLARAIAGLEEDCTGEIYLDGRDVIDIPPEKRRIGLVTSDPGLWPGYSAGANVELGLKSRGIARQDRKARISEALSWFGVDSLKHRRVESLSLIESRRVALARALAVDPQVLLLDEPLANLNEAEKLALHDDIARVQTEQRLTVTLLTREVEHWWSLADRLSLLSEGRILQSGSAESVLNRPVSLEAAALLGPCNVIEGVVEAADPRGEALVRTACGRLLGRISDSGQPAPRQGDQALVLIRPESIAFAAVASANSAQVNRVPVRVLRTNFEGRTFRCELEAPGETPMTASLTAGQASGIRPDLNLAALIPAELISVVIPEVRNG